MSLKNYTFKITTTSPRGIYFNTISEVFVNCEIVISAIFLTRVTLIVNGYYHDPFDLPIYASWGFTELTHWGRVMHICISMLTITGSDNGLSPGRCQAIIWTNAGIFLIGHLGTNFSENLIAILTFHSGKCIWKCHLRHGCHFVLASIC